MAQVIIYSNSNGGVFVCIPTGELPIQEVLTKDCPEGAIIVDDSTLPQGDDANYFDAWVLNNGIVTVNADKKATILKDQCVAKAKQLLADSDWTQVSDVGLKNQADFVSYRGILRGLVISPVVDAVFPDAPVAIFN